MIRWFNVEKVEKVADSFRYLHDEIAGGVFAYSHIKCKAAYSGNSVKVDTNIYGYVNNAVPLTQIRSENPLNAGIIFYEQLNSYDAGSIGGDPWDGTDYTNRTCKAYGLSGFSLGLNQAKTFAVVIDMKTSDAGLTQGVIGIGNNRSVYQSLVYASNDNLYIRKANGSTATSQFSGIRNTGLHLLIWVDDGSLNTSGDTLYYDDVVTPKALTSSSGSISNAVITDAIYLKSWVANDATFDGYVKESHCWNRVLTEAELIALKEIFEQYYTIP